MVFYWIEASSPLLVFLWICFLLILQWRWSTSHFQYSHHPEPVSIQNKINMSTCWRMAWNFHFCKAIDLTFPISRSPTHSQNAWKAAKRALKHKVSSDYIFLDLIIMKVWIWVIKYLLVQSTHLSGSCWPAFTALWQLPSCMMSSARTYEYFCSTAFLPTLPPPLQYKWNIGGKDCSKKHKQRIKHIDLGPEKGSKSENCRLHKLIFYFILNRIARILSFLCLNSDCRSLVENRNDMLKEQIWKYCMLRKCL